MYENVRNVWAGESAYRISQQRGDGRWLAFLLQALPSFCGIGQAW
jgi:hypothetical protein